MIEIWKPIINFEDSYEISSFGTIRSFNRTIKDKRGINKTFSSKILKIHIMTSGYNFYQLIDRNGKMWNKSLHRSLLEHFKPIPNHKNFDVNHIDGNKLNNSLDNLEWITHSENIQHSYNVLFRKGVNFGRVGKENKLSKKVEQLSLDGNLIKIWDSMMDYERDTGNRSSDISAVIRGKQKTAFGYKWRLYK